MKSLLIEDTTVDERMQIVKEALGGFGNCDCEGIDMDDMYDDYIFGRRELADINREFSQQHAGAVKAEDRERPSGCECTKQKTTKNIQRTIGKWN